MRVILIDRARRGGKAELTGKPENTNDGVVSTGGSDVDVLYVAPNLTGGIILAASVAVIWAEVKPHILNLLEAPRIRREIKRANALAEQRAIRTTPQRVADVLRRANRSPTGASLEACMKFQNPR